MPRCKKIVHWIPNANTFMTWFCMFTTGNALSYVPYLPCVRLLNSFTCLRLIT